MASRRSIWSWSTSIPSRPPSPRCRLCRLHRADRRRRPGHDPCRRQEPSTASPWWSSPPTTSCCWRRSRPAAPRPRCAAGWRPRRSPARLPMMASSPAGSPREIGEEFPERVVLSGTRRSLLRYGENPHQRAAFYATGGKPMGLARARQLQGKELFNNLNDTDTALAIVADFADPPSPSSSTPTLRRGRRPMTWPRPTARRWRVTRSAPSAASSPATGRSTARPRVRSPGSSPRS